MDKVLKQLPIKAEEKHTENKKFFAKLKKKASQKYRLCYARIA